MKGVSSTSENIWRNLKSMHRDTSLWWWINRYRRKCLQWIKVEGIKTHLNPLYCNMGSLPTMFGIVYCTSEAGQKLNVNGSQPNWLCSSGRRTMTEIRGHPGNSGIYCKWSTRFIMDMALVYGSFASSFTLYVQSVICWFPNRFPFRWVQPHCRHPSNTLSIIRSGCWRWFWRGIGRRRSFW